MIEYSFASQKECEKLMNNDYVLLEFYASWCGTCRSVTRMLNHVDTLNIINIIRIDIDLHKNIMKKYDILGVPVIMILYQGEEVMRLGGSVNFEEFKTWFHQIDVFKELS